MVRLAETLLPNLRTRCCLPPQRWEKQSWSVSLSVSIRDTDKIQIVPHASAIIPGIANAEPVAIPADHLNMVKFISRQDGGYEKVSGYLQLLAEEAPGAIDARWAEQDRIKQGRGAT